MLKKVFLILFFCSTSHVMFSQSILDIQIVGISKNQPLRNFLIDFEKSHAVKFFFRDEWLESYIITPDENNKALSEALSSILGNEVFFNLMFDYAVIFSVDSEKIYNRLSVIQNAVLRKSDIDEIEFGIKGGKSASGNVIINGTIKSKSNNSPLPGVIIELSDTPRTTTNDQGYYEISIPRGEHILTYHIGNHRDRVVILKAYANGNISFSLEEMPTILEEVVIHEQTLNAKEGQIQIKIANMNRAPTFLGEVDLIKTIQNQAGVTTVGEIASGFNVRGGSVDQNLVLYDGVPIFNTTHALGFFTAFNSAAIKNVSFFRGGIPAEYGGRSSSVLSIDAAEGDPMKWKVSGNIGLISSELTAGGPIKKDTTLVTASFRSSNSDWILDVANTKYNLDNSSLSFYDASLKLTHKPNQNTKISFSGYTSLDRFTLINDTSYATRNIAASMRFDRTWGSKLFGSIALGFGQYTYSLKEQDASTAFDLEYGVTYPSLKFDFNHEGKYKLAFGLHNTLYLFNPGTMVPETTESTIKETHLDKVRSLETALYASEEFYIQERLFVEVGLRYSLFANFGSATIYHYASGQPLEMQNVVDSTVYNSHQLIKLYHGLEPRLSVRYNLGSNASLKLGYNRMYQYLHMVSNTAATAPVDIWQSGNPYFAPQVADQVSIGYYRNIKKNMYEGFAEVFYKDIRNVFDFKDGADLVLNKNLETELLNGNAHSYGFEFSISKVSGKLIASGNYTFSRSLRQVDGTFDSEKINDGKVYPSNFDQPHVVNLTWRYGVTRRIFFSGNFSYRMGRPMSLPEGAYTVDGVPITDFPYRNEYRIPDYHRMDLAIIIEGSHKIKKLWDSAWIFSVYNVYARRNAYAVVYQDDGNGHLYPYKLSVIGTIIPSVTYRFKF